MITHPNPWPIGIDYAKELNKAKISIACTSKYHYTIAKIFEIPACNSVLLCDYTSEMKDLGFIPGHNFIEIKKGEIGYIEDILHSPKKLNEICRNGYELVHKNHTTEIRVKELLRLC
jgi:spore maturation protein CgeB